MEVKRQVKETEKRESELGEATLFLEGGRHLLFTENKRNQKLQCWKLGDSWRNNDVRIRVPGRFCWAAMSLPASRFSCRVQTDGCRRCALWHWKRASTSSLKVKNTQDDKGSDKVGSPSLLILGIILDIGPR